VRNISRNNIITIIKGLQFLNSMVTKYYRYLGILILIFFALLTPGEVQGSPELQDDLIELVVVGEVLDSQGVPVVDAEIMAVSSVQQEPLAEAQSQEDGSWVLTFPEIPLQDLQIEVAHSHFSTQYIDLQESELRTLNQDDIYQLEPVILDRRLSAGFWVATWMPAKVRCRCPSGFGSAYCARTSLPTTIRRSWPLR